MTDNIKLPPLPPFYIVPRVEPVDYPEVAQVLMDYAREAVRMNACESRATTHSEVCWSWGPAHYECAVREIKALRAEVERLQEVVRPKREDECLTLDHWRMRAYYLEENWSRCSRACAIEQDKRELAEARADKLAEALEDLIAWIPSADAYRRLGFDPETPMRALEKARAALAKENSND